MFRCTSLRKRCRVTSARPVARRFACAATGSRGGDNRVPLLCPGAQGGGSLRLLGRWNARKVGGWRLGRKLRRIEGTTQFCENFLREPSVSVRDAVVLDVGVIRNHAW